LFDENWLIPGNGCDTGRISLITGTIEGTATADFLLKSFVLCVLVAFYLERERYNLIMQQLNRFFY
jgi:hypothetical protein